MYRFCVVEHVLHILLCCKKVSLRVFIYICIRLLCSIDIYLHYLGRGEAVRMRGELSCSWICTSGWKSCILVFLVPEEVLCL